MKNYIVWFHYSGEKPSWRSIEVMGNSDDDATDAATKLIIEQSGDGFTVDLVVEVR